MQYDKLILNTISVNGVLLTSLKTGVMVYLINSPYDLRKRHLALTDENGVIFHFGIYQVTSWLKWKGFKKAANKAAWLFREHERMFIPPREMELEGFYNFYKPYSLYNPVERGIEEDEEELKLYFSA